MNYSVNRAQLLYGEEFSQGALSYENMFVGQLIFWVFGEITHIMYLFCSYPSRITESQTKDKGTER